MHRMEAHGFPDRGKGRQTRSGARLDFPRHESARAAHRRRGLVFAISNGEFARQSKGDGALFTSAERIAKHAGNTVLYAFDATTGKQLYSSGDIMPSFTHFSGISIASGRVYVTTFDSNVYAFGLKQ